MSTPKNPHPDCWTCHDYLDSRIDVLPAAIVKYAAERGITTDALMVEYAEGVHARHLAGLSLDADA